MSSPEASSDDAVVAVDERGRIRAWNAAAELILGVASKEALGRACHEVIGGRDVFGNRLCHENCVVQVMAREGEPIRPFRWTAHPRPGVERAARVSITREAGSRGKYTLVHVLHANGAMEQTEGLSAREREVFAGVARGLRNREIAALLGISPATVRNHVQSIIQKLGVRSKLEALAKVLRGSENTLAD